MIDDTMPHKKLSFLHYRLGNFDFRGQNMPRSLQNVILALDTRTKGPERMMRMMVLLHGRK
jgi:hypothetical protein